MDAVLATHSETCAFAMRDVELFAGGDGGGCDLELISTPFSASTRFTFDHHQGDVNVLEGWLRNKTRDPANRHSALTPFACARRFREAHSDSPMSTSGVTPPGWHAVTPRIVVDDASALVAFVCDVFGAEGKYDPASPTIVTIGDSKIMISVARARRPNAAFLYVYVGDADSIYRRALERGAASIEAPFDTPYGDLRCMVEDRWGNTFNARRCDP